MPEVTNTQAENERVCPHCGTDRYKAHRLDRRENAMRARDREFEKVTSENGRLRAQVSLARAEGIEVRRGMQGKLNRQAKVIRRLERKLLELGQQPHEGVHPGETAPVSDFAESVNER